MLKFGDKVKILPTILSDYPDFPYVGVVGRVCDMADDSDSVGVEFSTPCNYLHDCGGYWRDSRYIRCSLFGRQRCA